jgi:hypothetical protein
MRFNPYVAIAIVLIVLVNVIAALPVQPLAATDTVYITRTGQKYHAGGCSSLRKSKMPISRADAIKRGYAPCKVCRP